MEHIGAQWGVILSDEQLRQAVTGDGGRPRPSGHGFRLRLRLADALRALAARIEPLARRDKQSLAESLPLLDRGVPFGGSL